MADKTLFEVHFTVDTDGKNSTVTSTCTQNGRTQTIQIQSENSTVTSNWTVTTGVNEAHIRAKIREHMPGRFIVDITEIIPHEDYDPDEDYHKLMSELQKISEGSFEELQ